VVKGSFWRLVNAQAIDDALDAVDISDAILDGFSFGVRVYRAFEGYDAPVDPNLYPVVFGIGEVGQQSCGGDGDGCVGLRLHGLKCFV
jgi:hypothetical protein